MNRPHRPDPPASADEAREQLLAYAFRALGQRMLSEAELRTRLLRRTDDEALAEAVLTRVRELGYLSDEQVARAEGQRRGVGGYRVRQKLRQRGLDEDLIEETLEARDPQAELEDARRVLERRWDSFQRAADPRARAYGFLMRRGYPGGVIRQVLDELQASAESADR
ncbi:RecX family transcriptional regulator [Deinococcus sonorensis]|uniref:Regulatory protein RecX n=2 Tax=Deinococcus sonorensis TaxID=309891 RepID=A0AAU7U9T6_9DEIO